MPFFFSGGTFYWDEKPEQSKVYTFEHGVNIINLTRAGGVWELETVSAPFVKHSHKINLIHPQISGEREVLKVVSTSLYSYQWATIWPRKLPPVSSLKMTSSLIS